MRSLPSLRLLAAALVAAAAFAARAGPAEAAFWRCWEKDVQAPCIARGAHGDSAAFETCKAELGKTACAAERARYEKELAAGIAADALDLVAASIKRVCLAEAAALFDGKLLPDEEAAVATGWREALDVRAEFMRACERSGKPARDCDDQANEAERRARAACQPGR